jgi:hypothetical protein
MLAAASLGATWSSCSPDFGIKGVLDRFGQIKPRIIFTANGYQFKGKSIDSLERISDVLKQLPSIEKVVVVPYTQQRVDISKVPMPSITRTLYLPNPIWRSNLSSCLLSTLSILCIHPVPPVCPNAWSRAPAAFSFIISKN